MKNKIVLIILCLFLNGCFEGNETSTAAKHTAAPSAEQINQICAVDTFQSAPQTIENQSDKDYNPYRLAQFPMGCQYKGYELCDPIYDPDELEDENIDRGGSYIYAPMKRLYFPDDYLSALRESTSKTAEIDDYVGVWSPATRHDMDGEVKKL